MTPHEKLGLAVLGLIAALFVLGVVTHYTIEYVWWWPLVGSAWRAERHRVRLAQRTWHDVWQDETQDFPGPALTILCPACDAGTSPQEACTCFLPDGLRAGEADWDHLDPDSQADQLIAEWHDEPAPTEPWVYIPDRNTWRWQDDPDLIVWDARQQAARCWEIVHVEFPRLRRELGVAA